MSRIDNFFDNCTIGTLLPRCGTKNLMEHPDCHYPGYLRAAVYRGITISERLGIKKDAA